mmetsp:Transcript_26425/g.49375  ORF Transcript_26425/g.49375 Transcript_26425/m.49375 type:complete len:328 (-) Transcript_26425:501-1484(-)
MQEAPGEAADAGRWYHDDQLWSVSEALARLMGHSVLQGDGKKATNTAFDIENFMERTYVVSAPSFPTGCPIPCYAQRERQIAVPKPTRANLQAFLRQLIIGARLAPECMIVALIYVDRLSRGRRAVRLSSRNWIPITMISLLTASKVWEDRPTWNGKFSALFPALPLRGLNRLEFTFHAQLQFNLHISRNVYTKYFFALRSLQQKRAGLASGGSGSAGGSPSPLLSAVPKYYLKLSQAGAAADGTGGIVRRSSSFRTLQALDVKQRSRSGSSAVTFQHKDTPQSSSSHADDEKLASGGGGGMESRGRTKSLGAVEQALESAARRNLS